MKQSSWPPLWNRESLQSSSQLSGSSCLWPESRNLTRCCTAPPVPTFLTNTVIRENKHSVITLPFWTVAPSCHTAIPQDLVDLWTTCHDFADQAFPCSRPEILGGFYVKNQKNRNNIEKKQNVWTKSFLMLSGAHGNMWSRSRRRCISLIMSQSISTRRDAQQRPTLPGLARTEYKEEARTSAFRLRHRSKTNTTSTPVLRYWRRESYRPELFLQNGTLAVAGNGGTSGSEVDMVASLRLVRVDFVFRINIYIYKQMYIYRAFKKPLQTLQKCAEASRIFKGILIICVRSKNVSEMFRTFRINN